MLGKESRSILILTDFENAMQVTARSKKPIPMTCRVFSVTESQMRTCGGSCCLERIWPSFVTVG